MLALPLSDPVWHYEFAQAFTFFFTLYWHRICTCWPSPTVWNLLEGRDRFLSTNADSLYGAQSTFNNHLSVKEYIKSFIFSKIVQSDWDPDRSEVLTILLMTLLFWKDQNLYKSTIWIYLPVMHMDNFQWPGDSFYLFQIHYTIIVNIISACIAVVGLFLLLLEFSLFQLSSTVSIWPHVSTMFLWEFHHKFRTTY